MLPISTHADKVIDVTRGYRGAEKPEDFLDNFTTFVRSNLNKIAALSVVVQRPRDLTRQQLRELRLELDRQAIQRDQSPPAPGSRRRTRTSPHRSSALSGRRP